MSECECYKIGGPFITFDPECPAHGYEAQQRDKDHDAAIKARDERIARLEAALREVCDELDYYGDQAGEYFREKGRCDETLAKARALLPA